MRLTVARLAFKAALERVAPLAANKTYIPILKNVLLEAHDGALLMRCSNQEITIRTQVPCEVHRSGEFTVPARLLLDVVNSAAGDIEMSLDNVTLHVTSGRSKWKLMGLSAKDYPGMPYVSEGSTFKMPLVVLRQVIQQAVFACATDATRPSLVGIHFAGMSQDPHMEVTSTDTHRITLRTIELDEPADVKFVLPRETAAVIMRTFDGDGEISVTVNGSRGIELEEGVTLVHSALVDSSGFPNARRVIPTNFTADFRIERKTFSDILRRVSLVLSGENEKVVLVIVDEHAITLMSNSENAGVAEETVDHLGGTGIASWCFQVAYLQEMLTALDSEILRVQGSTTLIPVLITGDNQDYLYLQAPCSIPKWVQAETLKQAA